jgi:nitrate reductase NapE component
MALLSLMIFLESSFRRRLSQLISSVTIGLAALSTLVLIYQFFWPIVALAVLVAGGYVVWENVREL